MTLALVAMLLAQPYPNVMSVRNPTTADGGVRALSVNSSAADPAHVVLEGFDAGFMVTGVVTVRNMPPPPARNPLTGAAKVDGSGSIQPVSAVALPLPVGAASDAMLSQILDGGLTVRGIVTIANPAPPPARNLAGAAKVDGSGTVQPISVIVLPLPVGAAQEGGGNLAAILAAVIASQSAPLSFTQMPLNPFLPRCNAVRRTNCQP